MKIQKIETVKGTPADLSRDYSLTELGRLKYCHDDSETTEDFFTFFGKDGAGHKTEPLTIKISIDPVNDHQVVFVDSLQV